MLPRSQLRSALDARAEAHTQNAWLASIVDSSDDAIMAQSPEGAITFWNHGAERIYGYTANETIGRPVLRLTHADRQEEMALILARVRNGERTDHHETIGLRKDGKTIAVSLTVSPIMNESGSLVGISTVARDITARRRTEDSAREASGYARNSIEASLDPLLAISVDGRITDANQAMLEATGTEREVLIGTDFSDYFTEPSKARGGYLKAFATGSLTDHALTVRHQRGKLTDLVFNASVYKDTRGDVLGVFAAGREAPPGKCADAQVAKELDQLVELERFKKLTVGRELKMIGLKREVEELQRELAAFRAVAITPQRTGG